MLVRDRVKKVFEQSLEISSESSFEKLSYRGIPEWDSVGHMRLIAALETEFGVMFSTDQILDLSDFDKALETLDCHAVRD